MLASLRIILAVIGVVGLVSSVLFHIAMFLWSGLQPGQAEWMLNQRLPVGIACLVIMVIGLLLSLPNNLNQMGSRRQFWVRITRYAPVGMRLLLTALIVYFVASVAIHLITQGNGGPAVRDGLYAIELNGDIVRELSAEEFARATQDYFRLMAALLMVLSCLIVSMILSKLNEPADPEPIVEQVRI